MSIANPRRAILVLGDQLDIDAAVLAEGDPARDVVVMSEVREEASYVPQHKKRLVLFFSAMRHFAEALREKGWEVRYQRLDDADAAGSLPEAAVRVEAESHHVTLPGDWRVKEALEARLGELHVHDDTHFLASPARFAEYKSGRKRFILEDFYRMMRKDTGYLLDGDGKPVGGKWNLDHDNRKSFGKKGPGMTPGRPDSSPDDITREVMKMVEREFPDAPGSTEGFAEPVTRRQALAHLDDFIKHRLPLYGDYQDAIATGYSTLYHARISQVMNLKLIHPREAVERVIAAYEAGHAPLNAVEGFVRQVIGWREFIRGVYYTEMPDYAGRNGLGAHADLPSMFWTAETDMHCMSDSVGQLLAEGYAHHIQRLMVLGLFSLLWGTHPYKFHEWHMGMYLDSIDWVSLPNALGMSQHGDHGVVGTKPYTASGNYISKMSDYCRGCNYDPKASSGEKACPFTVMYWDFLDRHRDRFGGNMRMGMQYRNLARKDGDEIKAIRKSADVVRKRYA
ncbi:MAG: cryptochrome/photolyase family protein [Pseudomonadota bacterium]